MHKPCSRACHETKIKRTLFLTSYAQGTGRTAHSNALQLFSMRDYVK